MKPYTAELLNSPDAQMSAVAGGLPYFWTSQTIGCALSTGAFLGLLNAQVPTVRRDLFQKPDERPVAHCHAKPTKRTFNLANSQVLDVTRNPTNGPFLCESPNAPMC